MAFSAIISLGALSGRSSLERTLVFPVQQEELEIQPYDTSTHKNSIHIFTPIDISEKIAARQQKKKITHIDIAIDETTAYPKQIRNTPENIYREEILGRLIYSIPGNGPSVTIWSIGSSHKNYRLQHPNQLDIGQQHIATNIFHQGIDKIAEELTARKKPAALVVIKEFSSITESDELTLRRGGVKFCKPVVGAAGGVDEEFESKGKGVELGLDAEAVSQQATDQVWP